MHDICVEKPVESSCETVIRSLDIAHRAILRCREKDIEALSHKMGIALPRDACRSVPTGSLSALWLGPGEWLLLAPEPAKNWCAAHAVEVDDPFYSLVDISHRQIAFEIKGAHCEQILATGCALDTDIAHFPIGMCTRTMFHKAEIVLWRTGADSFHLEVWRSFARYAEALLREAENEA